MLSAFSSRLEEVANTAVQTGQCFVPLELKPGAATGHYVVAARLDLPQQPQEQCVLVDFFLKPANPLPMKRYYGYASQARLRIVTRCTWWRLNTVDSEKFASVLDLFMGLADERRYVAMAMGICNGLAAKFKCDGVSFRMAQRGIYPIASRRSHRGL